MTRRDIFLALFVLFLQQKRVDDWKALQVRLRIKVAQFGKINLGHGFR